MTEEERIAEKQAALKKAWAKAAKLLAPAAEASRRTRLARGYQHEYLRQLAERDKREEAA